MALGFDDRDYALHGGERIVAALRVWAAGVKAPGVLNGLGPTLPNRRKSSSTRDCARCTDEKGQAVPATAQAAREQAIDLAAHLEQALSNGQTPAFPCKHRGSIVSLGDCNGWETLGRYQFGGVVLRGLSERRERPALQAAPFRGARAPPRSRKLRREPVRPDGGIGASSVTMPRTRRRRRMRYNRCVVGPCGHATSPQTSVWPRGSRPARQVRREKHDRNLALGGDVAA